MAAWPRDSGFLLPDEIFEITLTAPGVYDYYCLPHEIAAMVGRLVVGTLADASWEGQSEDTSDVSDEIPAALPPVEPIIAKGVLRQEGRS